MYVLLIGNKIDDLGIRRISRHLADSRQMPLMAAAVYDDIASFSCFDKKKTSITTVINVILFSRKVTK